MVADGLVCVLGDRDRGADETVLSGVSILPRAIQVRQSLGASPFRLTDIPVLTDIP